MVYISNIFSDNMVFQKGKDIKVYGNIEVDTKIEISLDGKSAEKLCTAGDFTISLPPINTYKKGLTLTIKYDNELKTYKNICIGEVFVLSGQSNMEFPLMCDKKYDEELENFEKNDDIRFFDVIRKFHKNHNTGIKEEDNKWLNFNKKDIGKFCSVGYFFAKKLIKYINAPIGLIGANKSGALAMGFIPRESFINNKKITYLLNEYEDVMKNIDLEDYDNFAEKQEEIMRGDLYKNFELKILKCKITQEEFAKKVGEIGAIAYELREGYRHYRRVHGLFDNMISTIYNFNINSVLYYQGESDTPRSDVYKELLSEMVTSYRKYFGEDISFFIVQLPSFDKWLHTNAQGYEDIRDKQEEIGECTKGVYTICTIDLGDKHDIHPKEKEQIGFRLANYVYAKKFGGDVLYKSPKLKNVYIKDKKIELIFSDDIVINENIHNELILEDKNKAQIQIINIKLDKNKLILEINEDRLKDNIYIKYGKRGYIETAIFSTYNLPAFPFSMDIKSY